MNLSEAVELLKSVAPNLVFERPYAEAFRVVLAETERVTTLVKCEGCDRGVRWRNAVKGLCPDCAAAEIDRLTAERDETDEECGKLTDSLLRMNALARAYRNERDAITKAVIVDGWDYEGEPEDNRSIHYWTIGNPMGEDEWYGSEAQAIEELRRLAGLDVAPIEGGTR